MITRAYVQTNWLVAINRYETIQRLVSKYEGTEFSFRLAESRINVDPQAADLIQSYDNFTVFLMKQRLIS